MKLLYAVVFTVIIMTGTPEAKAVDTPFRIYICTATDESRTVGPTPKDGQSCEENTFSASDRWEKVGEDSKTTMHADQASVAGDFKVMRFWLRAMYKKGLRLPGNGRAYSSLARMEIDCGARTVTIIEERFFDKNEGELVGAAHGPQPAQSIAPGTIIELFLPNLCVNDQ